MGEQLAADGAGLVHVLADRLDLDQDTRQLLLLLADHQRGMAVDAPGDRHQVERRSSERSQPRAERGAVDPGELGDPPEHPRPLPVGQVGRPDAHGPRRDAHREGPARAIEDEAPWRRDGDLHRAVGGRAARVRLAIDDLELEEASTEGEEDEHPGHGERREPGG